MVLKTVQVLRYGRSVSEPISKSECLIEISIPSRLEFVSLVRMIVASATSSAGVLSDERLEDLRWVTSEATTNAIEANQSASPSSRVNVKCEFTDGGVLLSVKDEGSGMPELVNEGRIEDSAPDYVDGSIGIPLMRHLANALNFSSGAGGTLVEMELRQAG